MTEDNVQLTIDDVVYNLDEDSLDTLTDSINRRNKTIDKLQQRIDKMDKPQMFKVGDEEKEYSDMGMLYSDMQKVIDACMAKMDKMNCDMKNLQADMKSMKVEEKKNNDEYTSKISSLKQAVAKLEGEKSSLENELSKRLDAQVIEDRTKERVNLIYQVKELNLDSENLLEMTNREIKIDSILQLNKSMDSADLINKPDAYIDGAFEGAIGHQKKREDMFEERKDTIEQAFRPSRKGTKVTQEAPQIDEDLQRRIKILNGGI